MPRHVIPDPQYRAFELAMCKRLGLNPDEVVRIGWQTGGETHTQVTVLLGIPEQEVIDLFNGAADDALDEGPEEAESPDQAEPPRTRAFRYWRAGNIAATVHDVTHVEFGPAHVVFHLADGTLQAERVEQVNRLTEIRNPQE